MRKITTSNRAREITVSAAGIQIFVYVHGAPVSDEEACSYARFAAWLQHPFLSYDRVTVIDYHPCSEV